MAEDAGASGLSGDQGHVRPQSGYYAGVVSLAGGELENVLEQGQFIRGDYEVTPRGRFLRRLGKVTFSFGEPIDPRGPDRAAASCNEVVEPVRERVVGLGERLL